MHTEGQKQKVYTRVYDIGSNARERRGCIVVWYMYPRTRSEVTRWNRMDYTVDACNGDRYRRGQNKLARGKEMGELQEA